MSKNSNLISGLFWSFIELFSRQGLQLLIQIILARLLFPEDFGLIGMITIFVAITTSLLQSGLDQALIREKKVSNEDYSTVFIFNFIVSLLLYIIVYIFSPMIANFYNEEQIIPILRVLMIVVIINSLAVIQKVILIRNLNFKKQSIISVISTIFSGVASIILAINGFGVWSLVAQQIVLRLVETILLITSNNYVPSFQFNTQSFKKYFIFGYRLMLSGLINTVYNNIYFVIIGRMFNVNVLGYYTNANKLKEASTQSITSAIQKVTYPILSQQQDDAEKLSKNYIQLIKVTGFLMFPFMLGIVAISPELIPFLLGDKWIPSVPYFQLLCVGGMLYPIHALNLNILKVKNRSDLFLKLEIIKKGLLTIFIIFAILLDSGVNGLIFASILGSFGAFFINSWYSSREINYSFMKQIKDLVPSLFLSVFMAIILLFVGDMIQLNYVLTISLQMILGIIIYIGLSLIFKIKEFYTILKLLK